MDRMASIELALKNEKVEMEFYLAEANRSRNKLAKNMFQTLAQDEREHMQRLTGLHGKLLRDKTWPENMPIEVKGTDIRKVLDSLASNGKNAEGSDDDDLAALEKAAIFEARGAKFYSDLSAACSNPMEKSFFAFLSRIEREHHLSITDSLAYLRDPNAWMLQHEKAGLDGAP